MELAASVLLLVLAAVPFLWGRSRRTSALILAAVALVGLALFGAVAVAHHPAPREREVAGRPIQVATEGFVTSSTCRSCHPSHYASWDASYHRRMTQVVRPGTVLGDFGGVALELRGKRYRLERREDSYWVKVSEPDGKEADYPIVMSTGSHHMQVYWYPSGASRILGQLPFLWLREEARWVPRYAAFLRPVPQDVDETRRWNFTCNKCHATNARPGIASLTEMDTQVSEFGIACEACHGPAANHVQANRDPLRRHRVGLGDRHDETIVNPRRLDHVRASHVCAQCHSLSQFLDQAAVLRWQTDGYPYRAGDDLTDTRYFMYQGQRDPSFLAHLREDPGFMDRKFYADGALRMAGREFIGLLQTPCFRRGDMSCLSCHSLHQPADDRRPAAEWADDQLKPGMRGNLGCAQCHTGYVAEKTLTGHTHHRAGSPGSECYNCHLPYTAYGLLKAIRSHQLDVPSAATSVATGRPNGCNQCHLRETLAWTAGWLEKWYGTPVPSLDQDQRTISASVLWIIRGDATQRALAAWTMGWSVAQRESGTDWLAPYLGQLLSDQYDAVRYIAYHSLRTLPGYETFRYDYVRPKEEQVQAAWQVFGRWEAESARAAVPPSGDSVLIDVHGRLNKPVLQRLAGQIDNRMIELDE